MQKHPDQIRRMFGRIAHRYDLMNRLITFGQDRSWRRRVLELADPPWGGSLLDVGTGTGAIARQATRRRTDLHVVGCDFSPRMLGVARTSRGGERVEWERADALDLPFPDQSFDCVTSGYLVRNVADIALAFREQARVLRGGGRVVCLETAPPPSGVLSPLVSFYLHRVLPRIGQLVVGDRRAYRYLTESTLDFLEPQRVAEVMEGAGLEVECIERRMFGTQTILAAVKPGQERG